MSNLSDQTRGQIFRQHTQAIVVCHSHQGDREIDLSQYVINITTNKSLKSVGTCSLTLVAERNWLNWIFPNDLLNIYFCPNDGVRGPTRTFLGYVDRIERTESVNSDTGEIVTVFNIQGSDFSKAVEKTEIYFNPQIAGRADFILDPRYSKSNLGGHALRTRGILMHGSPSSITENLFELLMGFGSQWILPETYASRLEMLKDNREKRVQNFKDRIPKNTLNLLAKNGIQSFTSVDTFFSSAENPFQALELKHSEMRQQLLEEQRNLSKKKDKESKKKVREINIKLKQIGDATNAIVGDSFLKIAFALKNQLSYQAGISDLVCMDFIEHQATDGYDVSAQIVQQTGSLLSIMNNNSNSIINEMFFDLRPVADGEFPAFGNSEKEAESGKNEWSCGYSTEPDELGINIRGFGDIPASKKGVKYVPALVFREYPFSTIHGIDLTEFAIGGREFRFNEKNEIILSEQNKLGKVVFGKIFSVKANPSKPMRVFSKLEQPISVYAIDPNNKLDEGYKHLDVIPITTSDVKSSNIGRSDKDLFNFFALYNSGLLGQNWKYLAAEILPIVTPVSIARDGLRVREMTTKSANFSADFFDKDSQRKIDNTNIRQKLIRWCLLVDAWMQHNREYLNGSIQLRPMPEIRVGYRLDWTDREESYYVESVTHQWNYPGAMSTSIQVVRGQPNNPFPLYVWPTFGAEAGASYRIAKGMYNEIFYEMAKEDTQEARKAYLQAKKEKDEDAIKESSEELTEGFKDLKDIRMEKAYEKRNLDVLGGGNRRLDGRLAKHFEVGDVPANERRTLIGTSNNKKNADLGGYIESDLNSDYGLVEPADSDKIKDRS